MEKRPRLKIALNSVDKTIEAVSWFTLALLWLWVFYHYSLLPNTIPTHFNAAGVVDAYGDKKNIFTLPSLGTLLFVVLTVLNNYPHIFNYTTVITQQNAQLQYSNATRMLRYLKFAICIIFLLITVITFNIADGNAKGLGSWFLPLCISAIFGIMAFFIIKSFKKNNN